MKNLQEVVNGRIYCSIQFSSVKMITTGEGGMALTNNEEYAKKMDLFRSHGITRDSSLAKKIYQSTTMNNML